MTPCFASSGIQVVTASTTILLHALMVQLNWQSSDLPGPTTTNIGIDQSMATLRSPAIPSLTSTTSSMNSLQKIEDSSSISTQTPSHNVTSTQVTVIISTTSIISSLGSSLDASSSSIAAKLPPLLSNGDKAGIVISAILGMIGLGILLFYLLRGMKRPRLEPQKRQNPQVYDSEQELSKAINRFIINHNASCNMPQMDAEHGSSELPLPDPTELPRNEVRPTRHELSGSTSQRPRVGWI